MNKLILLHICFLINGVQLSVGQEESNCIVTFEVSEPDYSLETNKNVRTERTIDAEDASRCATLCYESNCKIAAFSPNLHLCLFLKYDQIKCANTERHFLYPAQKIIWLHCMKMTCVNPIAPSLDSISANAKQVVTETSEKMTTDKLSEMDPTTEVPETTAREIATFTDDDMIDFNETSNTVVESKIENPSLEQTGDSLVSEKAENHGIVEFVDDTDELESSSNLTKADEQSVVTTGITNENIKETTIAIKETDGRDTETVTQPQTKIDREFAANEEIHEESANPDETAIHEKSVHEESATLNETAIHEESATLAETAIHEEPAILEKSPTHEKSATEESGGIHEETLTHNETAFHEKSGTHAESETDEESTTQGARAVNEESPTFEESATHEETETTPTFDELAAETVINDQPGTVSGNLTDEETMMSQRNASLPEITVQEETSTTTKTSTILPESATQTVSTTITPTPVTIAKRFFGPYVCGLSFTVAPLYLYPIGQSLNFTINKLTISAAECAGLCFVQACTRAAYDPLSKLCLISNDDDIPDSCSTSLKNPLYLDKEQIWIQCVQCDEESLANVHREPQSAGLNSDDRQNGDFLLKQRLNKQKLAKHDVVLRKVDSAPSQTDQETSQSCVIVFEVDQNILNNQFTRVTITLTAANCAHRCLIVQCNEAMFEPTTGRCLLAVSNSNTQCTNTQLTAVHRVQHAIGIRCVKCVNDDQFRQIYGAEIVTGPIDRLFSTTTEAPLAVSTTRRPTRGCWYSFELIEPEQNLDKFSERIPSRSAFKCISYCYRTGCSQVAFSPNLQLCLFSFDGKTAGSRCANTKIFTRYTDDKMMAFQCLRLKCGRYDDFIN